MVEEGEQVTSNLAVSFTQPLPVFRRWRKRHHRIQIALQTAAIAPPRTLRQSAVPPRDHDRAQEQRLHTRREYGVTGVDGILAVAQLMRLMPMSA